jgi:hypothetical protein
MFVAPCATVIDIPDIDVVWVAAWVAPEELMPDIDEPADFAPEAWLPIDMGDEPILPVDSLFTALLPCSLPVFGARVAHRPPDG